MSFPDVLTWATKIAIASAAVVTGSSAEVAVRNERARCVILVPTRSLRCLQLNTAAPRQGVLARLGNVLPIRLVRKADSAHYWIKPVQREGSGNKIPGRALRRGWSDAAKLDAGRNWMLDKAIDLVSDLTVGIPRLVAVSSGQGGLPFISTVGRHG